jgi:hypothetical protein
LDEFFRFVLLDLHGFVAYLMDHLVIECILMYIKIVKYHGKAMNEKPTMGYTVSPDKALNGIQTAKMKLDQPFSGDLYGKHLGLDVKNGG